MLNEGWAMLSQIGLWGWIFAAVGLILRSFPSRGEFRAGVASRWGGALALFYLFWIVGMVNA